MKKNIQIKQDFESQIQHFVSGITRDYLQDLSICTILQQPVNSSDTNVRWYKISKLVLDKDVFFTDALSMLYTSLHGVAKNVSLVIDKNPKSGLSIFLGARDFDSNKFISGEVLNSAIHGYLPGASISKPNTKLPPLNYDNTFVSAVSALASLYDDKKEHFVQGIERLINATKDIPRYRAYFIADNVSQNEARSIIAAYNDLQSKLYPFLDIQLSYSESHAEGINQSLTESFSTSITNSLSRTVTHTEGTSSGTTQSYSESDNFSLIFVSGGVEKPHAFDPRGHAVLTL